MLGLAAILVLEMINFITTIYVNTNDTVGYNVVDMILIIKFIGVLSLFITLFWWNHNKDNDVLKDQVVVHTKYIFVISIFYFLISYLFKYSIILEVMDILRNKMIEGNSSLLLNFAVYSYNTLKYVQGVYQSFSSELVLMFELIFITWSLRNMMSLETDPEDEVQYDSFLHNPYLKYVSLLLLISSFLSINLFEYVFDFSGAVMFLVSSFIFSLQIPLFYFVRSLSNTEKNSSTKSHFRTFHRLSLLLSVITIVGYIVYLGLLIVFINGTGNYRFITTIISLALSSYMTYRLYHTLRLIEL